MAASDSCIRWLLRFLSSLAGSLGDSVPLARSAVILEPPKAYSRRGFLLGEQPARCAGVKYVATLVIRRPGAAVPK